MIQVPSASTTLRPHCCVTHCQQCFYSYLSRLEVEDTCIMQHAVLKAFAHMVTGARSRIHRSTGSFTGALEGSK